MQSDAPLILCAEDEPQLLRDLADELREAGYRVAEAGDGAALLALLGSCVPDLVLCDIMMPVLDGYGVLAGVRRDHPHLAHVPVVFLSALSMTDSAVRAKRAGADDYLTKPIDYGLLLSTIEARLRQSAEARRAVAPAARLGRHLLDRLGAGVIAYDAAGQRTEANAVALRMLATGPRGLEARLAAPVRSMAAAAAEGRETSLSLMLDDGASLMAQVHACPADPTLAAPAAVLVLIADPTSRAPLSEPCLRAIFGLTPSEAQVAHHLACGLRPDEIAARMGVAPTTIAFHLRNIFSKTSTHRQAELVALLLSLPLRAAG